jgi:hypothetical protein
MNKFLLSPEAAKVIQEFLDRTYSTYKLIIKFSDPSCPYALTEHHAMKGIWGNRCIAPNILDLSTRWR